MDQEIQNTQVPRNHIWTVSVCETSDSGTTGSSVPAHFPLPRTKTTDKLSANFCNKYFYNLYPHGLKSCVKLILLCQISQIILKKNYYVKSFHKILLTWCLTCMVITKKGNKYKYGS
jgi:hypothetical protein